MNVFIARQPIFDRTEKIDGYELLFRSGLENAYSAVDGDAATKQVITTTFSVIGLKELIGTKRAFINFTGNLLKEQIPALLPRDAIVVEILENIAIDRDIISACSTLKSKGYKLALDDFVLEDQYRPLLDLADIIKVDFLSTPIDTCNSIIGDIKSVSRTPKTFLAEKVENKEVYRKAVSMGYLLFQGYFFSKPEIKIGKQIPPNKLNYLSIVRELYTSEPEYAKLEEILKRDVALSYKLLKLVNSTSFGLAKKVTSIRHALMLMGIQEVRKWFSLITLSEIGQGKPDELVRASIIRARFCELLATKVGLQSRAPEVFLMGLFSMIDAFLDKTMEEVIKELPLSSDVKNVLTGNGSPLQPFYQLVVAYERGDWASYEKLMEFLGLDSVKDSQLMPETYFESLKWADELMKTTMG
jgi:EAL and modified HD-GYP domain-containing signal transduction protein